MRGKTNDGFRCAVDGESDISLARQTLQANPGLLNKSQDSLGNTALHVAAGNAWSDLVDLLIESGANVQARNIMGDTPLHTAAHYSNTQAANALLTHGANINEHDNDGETPLMYAA